MLKDKNISSRANSFILNELPEKLIDDWYSTLIFSEFDLQTTSYYWLRSEWEKYGSWGSKWTIRSQPQTELIYDKRRKDNPKCKPDIVFYKGTRQNDAIELKYAIDSIAKINLDRELEKFEVKSSVYRHVYILVLHNKDNDDIFPEKEDWMKGYLTFISANVKRNKSGRLRKNYELFKKTWDTYWNIIG